MSWTVSRPTIIVFVFIFVFSTVFVQQFVFVFLYFELVEWYPGQPAARHCSQPASSPLTCRRAKPFLLLMLLLLVLLLSLLCLLWCFFTDIKLTDTYFLYWPVRHQTIVFRLQPTVPFESLILLINVVSSLIFLFCLFCTFKLGQTTCSQFHAETVCKFFSQSLLAPPALKNNIKIICFTGKQNYWELIFTWDCVDKNFHQHSDTDVVVIEIKIKIICFTENWNKNISGYIQSGPKLQGANFQTVSVKTFRRHSNTSAIVIKVKISKNQNQSAKTTNIFSVQVSKRVNW